MSYLTPRSDEPFRPDLLDAIAELVGITIPTASRAALARSLADQLGAVDQLDALDLSTFNPAVEFDPRWHD